jgi:hypothetical protein
MYVLASHTHRDERVDVTARRCDVDELLLVDDCVAVSLWAAVLLLAAAAVVVLLVAVVLLLAALWTMAGAAALVVVDATSADVCCVPKASHPPSVPTIAAVATADFSRAANCLRRDVSGCAIYVIP